MNLVKLGGWYFNLDRLIKAGPGTVPGALRMVTDRGDSTELVGQAADEMRAMLDRYVAVAGSRGSAEVTAATDRDPATGLVVLNP